MSQYRRERFLDRSTNTASQSGASQRRSRPVSRIRTRSARANEACAAIRLAGGFAVAASYGDFDADTPVEAAGAWRMILVLRREDGASEPAGPAPLTATTTPASTSTTPAS